MKFKFLLCFIVLAVLISLLALPVRAQEPDTAEPSGDVFIPSILVNYGPASKVVIAVIFGHTDWITRDVTYTVVGYTRYPCRQIQTDVTYNDGVYIEDDKILGGGTILIDIYGVDYPCTEDWIPFFSEKIVISREYVENRYFAWINNSCVLPELGCTYARP